MTLLLTQDRIKALLALLITAFVAAGLLVLVRYLQLSDALALGFTLDFLFTVPLLYLFLIRKTDIPWITVVPLSVVMLLLANWMLPEEHQSYLALYKTFALPLLELCVLLVFVVKIRKAGKVYSLAGDQQDVYLRLQLAAKEIVPVPARVAPILATEAAMFYYAVALFKKRGTLPGFAYHRETALVATMAALMLLIVVETIAVHLLLMQWSVLVANILSVASLYSLVYLMAIAGAASRRPHLFNSDSLRLRFGLQETNIPLGQLAGIEKLRTDAPEGKDIASLGLLGNYNLMITVAEPQTLMGFYGIRCQYSKIVFWADDPAAFIETYKARTT